VNILVAAATALEIKPLLKTIQHKPFNDLDFVITGTGLTASVYHLLKQIQLKRPDMVIQPGVAGSFDPELEPGSVITVSKDRPGDEGVWEKKKFLSLFDLGLKNENDHPFKKGWLVNPNMALLKKTGLSAVKAITVNQITTDKQIINFYKDNYSASLETMEGAALHYVCLMEGIPFIQIRAISNFVGERNKKNWKMEQAILNLNLKLEQLVRALQS
jgi:futalosine hydrolase